MNALLTMRRVGGLSEPILRPAAGRAAVVILAAAWWGWLAAAAWAGAGVPSGQEGSRPKVNPSNLRQAENYKAAAKQYAALLETHPHSARLWSNLGVVRAMLGECPASLQALERARSLDNKLFAPWYYSGYCHLALHQDRLALGELERATSLNSKDASVWLLEAQAAAQLNQPALSFQAAVRLLELHARRPEGYYLAGEGGLSLAKQEYSRVMAKPSSVFALRLRAERNLGQGVPAAAAGDYRKALSLDPGAPDLLFGLGSANLADGKFREAEKDFRRCLELLPDAPWARLRLALALAAQSKDRQAADALSSIQPSRLGSPFEWEDLIAAGYLLGHPDAAEHWLGEAESRFPDVPAWSRWTERIAAQKAMPEAPARSSFRFQRPSSIALSITFSLTLREDLGSFIRPMFSDAGGFRVFRETFLAGEDIEAADQVADVLRRMPSDPAGAFVSGEIVHKLSLDFFQILDLRYPNSEAALVLSAQNYSAAGNQAKAIKIYRLLLQKDGPSANVLRGLARVYWKQNDWSKALPVLLQLAKVDPYDASIFVNLGRIYSYQQKLREAEWNFRRAVRIQPSAYEARMGLGEILETEGEGEKAVPDLEAAARLEPSNPRPHYLLSQIYAKLGEKELAAREMANFERLQDHNPSKSADQGNRLVPLE